MAKKPYKVILFSYILSVKKQFHLLGLPLLGREQWMGGEVDGWWKGRRSRRVWPPMLPSTAF